MNTNNIIQGLWIGPRLAALQRLSILSFLANGHEYHLYTYEDIADVPAGIVLKDASEILPRAAVFRNSKQDTYAAFSDIFRYKLLFKRGGWWADLDIICLRPFSFHSEYVFASEYIWGKDGAVVGEEITSGVIKAPAAAPILEYTCNVCETKNGLDLTWDELGPELIRKAVGRFGLQEYVQSAPIFCPVPAWRYRVFLEPQIAHGLSALLQGGVPHMYSVHLWHELWRRDGVDLDQHYAPNCPYEILRTRYSDGS
jgi:Glycosyltransferase sugar-binding region containing DXD motif